MLSAASKYVCFANVYSLTHLYLLACKSDPVVMLSSESHRLAHMHKHSCTPSLTIVVCQSSPTRDVRIFMDR